MTEKERNDYFYVCALIEYIARETLNHRGDIVSAIGRKGVEKLLHDAVLALSRLEMRLFPIIK